MRCNEGVDRISQLPDDHIIKILSFLSLKEAALTSVLSSRWLHLWKHTPNLKFVTTSFADKIAQQEGPLQKNINWVNSVIESHKALSLKEFTISFVAYKSNQQDVSKWLQFALSRRVESLELNFRVLPRINSHCLALEEIFRESNIPSCDFKFLKELCVNRLKVSGEAIKLFLRNCPLLERLAIHCVILTSDLEIDGMLKHLDIRTRLTRKSTKVCAPNLTSLGADYKSNCLLLENVPKLVRADLTFVRLETMHHFANAAAQLEILTITLYCPITVFSVPEMPKLNKLIVNYCEVCQNNLLPVTCFLRASPCLEQLKLEIKDRFPTPCCVFDILNNVESFPHHHLIVFEISGFRVGADDHIELLRYIVNNCVALERIILLPPFPKISNDVSDATVEEAWKTTKKRTRRQLAGKFKVPRHIKLFI